MAHTNREANLTLEVKRSNVHRILILAILVDLLSPIICAKIRTQGLFGYGERFLKVFTIYGHGSHFDQWTIPILAIFQSPARLRMKFEQHWPGGFRGKAI